MEDFIRMCGFDSVDELNAYIASYMPDIRPLVVPFYDVKTKWR